MDDPVGERLVGDIFPWCLPIKLMVVCPGDNALVDVESVCFDCPHYRGMKSMRAIICSAEVVTSHCD